MGSVMQQRVPSRTTTGDVTVTAAALTSEVPRVIQKLATQSCAARVNVRRISLDFIFILLTDAVRDSLSGV